MPEIKPPHYSEELPTVVIATSTLSHVNHYHLPKTMSLKNRAQQKHHQTHRFFI